MRREYIRIQGAEAEWVWGGCPLVHEIGPYSIVEYVRDDIVLFHPYVNGKDTNQFFNSLDKALLGAIDYRHNGLNSQMSLAAWKVLRKDGEE
jgi:hypothetical protein